MNRLEEHNQKIANLKAELSKVLSGQRVPRKTYCERIWEEPEITKLIELIEEDNDISTPAIAKELDRTKASVAGVMRRLGFKKVWTVCPIKAAQEKCVRKGAK